MNTREQWLCDAADLLRPLFGEIATVPPFRVSIGFPPKGGMSKRRVLGVCFSASYAADHLLQIFINPTISDVTGPDGILSTLIHEMVHASGIMNHGKDFGKVARYVGMEGKMTSTTANESLQRIFCQIVEKLGPIPHVCLDHTPPSQRPDKCRMKKCVCGSCGYTIRVAQKWISIGIPMCPACDTRLLIEE